MSIIANHMPSRILVIVPWYPQSELLHTHWSEGLAPAGPSLPLSLCHWVHLGFQPLWMSVSFPCTSSPKPGNLLALPKMATFIPHIVAFFKTSGKCYFLLEVIPDFQMQGQLLSLWTHVLIIFQKLFYYILIRHIYLFRIPSLGPEEQGPFLTTHCSLVPSTDVGKQQWLSECWLNEILLTCWEHLLKHQISILGLSSGHSPPAEAGSLDQNLPQFLSPPRLPMSLLLCLPK